MIHSPLYWYNVIIAEKNTFSNLNSYTPNIDDSQTLLQDIQSPSKVEDWRLVFWCVATCAFALEIVVDQAIKLMRLITARSRYGTLAWWVAVAKEYQHGDSLEQVDLQNQYPTVNESTRIVKLASAQSAGGVVNIKVAKIISGVPQPLDIFEELGFRAYVAKKQPAGINVNVINSSPDDLILHITVNYDPLVLKSTGEMISSPGVYPVEIARLEYINTLTDDEKNFDGVYELMLQQNQIEAADGVKSIYIDSASARDGVNPFQTFTQRYRPRSGYLVLHPDSTINYVPYV